MRRSAGRVYANLCTLPVPGHPSRPGDTDRSGLCAGGERMRVQAQVFDGRRPGAQHDTVGGAGSPKAPHPPPPGTPTTATKRTERVLGRSRAERSWACWLN